jgi:hypothetical protein
MCNHQGLVTKNKEIMKEYRKHVGTFRKCRKCKMYIGDKSLVYKGEKFNKFILKQILIEENQLSKMKYYGLGHA